MVEAAVISHAHDLRLQGFRMRAEHSKYRSGQPIITVRVDAIDSNFGGSIGILQFTDAPGDVVWMRIPEHRGSDAANAWKPDNDGLILAEFLTSLMVEFERLGFTSQVLTGETARRLATAREQLVSANDPEAVIGLATILRSAMIHLANEVYEARMRPEDADEPKGDDATTKLKYFVNRELSTVSERYRTAMCRTIDAVWDLNSALIHRANPSRADAETCIELVEALTSGITRINQLT